MPNYMPPMSNRATTPRTIGWEMKFGHFDFEDKPGTKWHQ
jgi:hypothetical protein